jgi:hypothetical protein
MFQAIKEYEAYCSKLVVKGKLTVERMKGLKSSFNGKIGLILDCQRISETTVKELRSTLKKSKIEEIELYNLALNPEVINLFRDIFLNGNFKSISLRIAILENDINTVTLQSLVEAIVRRACEEDGRLEKLYFDSFLSCKNPDVYANFLRLLNESTTLQNLGIPFRLLYARDFARAINNNNSLKEITLFIQYFDYIYATSLQSLLQNIKKVLKIEIYLLQIPLYQNAEIFTTVFNMTLLLNKFPFVTGFTGKLPEEIKLNLVPLYARNKAIMDPKTDPVVKANLLRKISVAQKQLLKEFRFNNGIWQSRFPSLRDIAASKAAEYVPSDYKQVLPTELHKNLENYGGFWSKPQSKRPHGNDEHELNKRQCTDETSVAAEPRV